MLDRNNNIDGAGPPDERTMSASIADEDVSVKQKNEDQPRHYIVTMQAQKDFNDLQDIET